MHIHRARSSDAQAIAEVHVSSWRTTYREMLPAAFLDGLRSEPRARYWSTVLGNMHARECVYVAKDTAGRVVAFASGGPNRGDDLSYDGELYAIYLLEGYQRQGIGTALIRAVAGHLATSATRALVVWVLASNPSRRFYAALGGCLLGTKQTPVGGIQVDEVAYGWPDIHTLLR
ncbi:MAG TPA: GNAT family N-acetyltransferase [Ktedonobacterales bacterium]|nr:GNAT family N-acetyltransferase [Ktedonobacterales bacterium]